jgi:hypothetical protein
VLLEGEAIEVVMASVTELTVVEQWGFPRFSAYEISPSARVCGGTVNMVNLCYRAPACPPICIALRERGTLPQNRQAPPIRAREGIRSITGSKSPNL